MTYTVKFAPEALEQLAALYRYVLGDLGEQGMFARIHGLCHPVLQSLCNASVSLLLKHATCERLRSK